MLSKFAIVEDNLLDNAPNSPRRVDTSDIALSIKSIAFAALVRVSTATLAPIFVLSKSLNVTSKSTSLSAPIWNVTATLVPKFLPANVVLSAIAVISVSNAVTSSSNAFLSAVSNVPLAA